MGSVLLVAGSPSCTRYISQRGDATDSDDGSEVTGDETSTIAQCPTGEATAVWYVALPEPPPDTETGELEREATCTIDGPATQGGGAWKLSLTCDERDGGVARPYELLFETEESPFATLEAGVSVQLHYAAWWAFEFGSGTRLSIVSDGTTRLLAIAESAEGGATDLCADVDDTFRAEANRWLAEIDARVEPGMCEPPWQFRIARGEAYAYPGESTQLSTLRAEVESARCNVSMDGGEGWTLRFVIWAT